MWRKSRQFAHAALMSTVLLLPVWSHTFAETSGSIQSGQEFDATQAFGPGDVKQGYESAEYQTSSRSLLERRGVKKDLIQFIENPPLGLPQVDVPEGHSATRSKIDLGRKLFFDRRLSINNTISCASCHIPEQGFTNNEISTAVGVEGRSVFRNAPTLYNVAYQQHLFLDGREISLETQVWQPLTARAEMAAPSIGYVINKIRRMTDYDGLFEQAFGDPGPDIQNIGEALASYQRTLVSGDSPFDQWYFGGRQDAISESAKRGFAVFVGKGQCAVCHRIDSDHALFTDHDFHNTGLGYAVSTGKHLGAKSKTTRVQLAPGVFAEISQEAIDAVSRQKNTNDLGLYRVTENPDDRWKFRTQILRNVELTAPYMHNGQFETLREVIDFYDQGGIPNELLSEFIRPLGLSESEKQDLEAFLKSLTGVNVPEIVADAFAAEIGDLDLDDPNWAHKTNLGY